MKKYALLPALLFLIVCCVSCYKQNSIPACSETTATNIRSINFFDRKATSPYFNQVVSNFKFTQLTTTWSGGTNCPQMDCVTTLLLQNSTHRTISFDYNIIFTLNTNNWNYQGVATIAPDSTLSVGEINTSAGSIALGVFTLQSINITYK